MRVIAGKARSLKLKTIPDLATRPTTDRIKETLFNMIQHGLADGCFLDLFAGSGAIGIEALSRGAEYCVFVEKSPKAMACIRENLQHTKLSDEAKVLQMDVFSALEKLNGQESFDYIFMDPPYNQELEKQVLQKISGSTLLAENGIVIVEASLETDFSYVEELGFSVIKKKTYQTNCHLFLEWQGA